jgi:hypothetical protein
MAAPSVGRDSDVMVDPASAAATIAAVIAAIDALNARQSTVVEIINDTDETLHFVAGEDNHESGEFATEPPRTIPPRQTRAFGSKDKSFAILTGDVGVVHYRVGERDDPVTWELRWSNPAVGDNHAETSVDGTEADRFEAAETMDPDGSAKVPARFTLSRVGAVPPPPPPGPDREIESTCIITVVNNTQETLTLVDQGHDPGRGDFFTFPNSDIDAGEFDSFASVETEGAEVGGSKGFVQYRVGDGDTFVTLEWDNPEQAQNTTTFRVDGTNPGTITVLDQIGAGEENVPVRFTISGASGGAVVPPPPPPPPPQEVFVPPVQEDEPTLRLGDGIDNGLDGWVEYLQSMLAQWGRSVDFNGVFDQVTLVAVRDFQDKEHDINGGELLVDGVVGHQTWAALQQESARRPSTDGLPPHTHEEHGPEARWWREGNPFYFTPEDVLTVIAVNTGDVALDTGDFTATGIVTGLDQQLTLTIMQAAAPGEDLFFEVFGLRDLLGPGSHPVTAFMPQELGGDNVSGTIDIP